MVSARAVALSPAKSGTEMSRNSRLKSPSRRGGYNIALFNISLLHYTDVSLLLMQPVLQVFMNESAYEKCFFSVLEAVDVLINF